MKNLIKRHKIEISFLVFVILLVLIVFSVTSFYNNNQEKKGHNVTNYESKEPIDPYTYLEEDEEFIVNEDANLLTEEKNLENYSFLDFKMVVGEEKNRVIFKIQNNSDEDIAGSQVEIELYDENQNKLDTIYAYISEIPKGDSLALTGFTKVDMEKVYDYKVVFSD